MWHRTSSESANLNPRAGGSSAGSFLGGFGLGAGLMYLLDPNHGRRRRAMARDKSAHLLRQQRDVLDKGARDLGHRAQGFLQEARSSFDDPHASDPVLEQRVRTRLGRLSSHPHAIEVQVRDGHVTLSGPILTHEANRLVRQVQRVRGVDSLEDRLERHDSPDNVSALQGPGHIPQPAWNREVWPPSVRLLAMGSGAILGGYGLARGGVLGKVGLLTGGALLLRATANLPATRLTGAGAGRRAVDIKKSIYIDAPVEEVFDFWRRLENFPKFMQHVREVYVHEHAPHRSHWKVDGPGGMDLGFEAEVSRLEENEVLAWRTLPNQVVGHAGIIHFQPEGPGTRLHIQVSYNPPAGAIGHAILRMLGSDPKSRMDEDLIRMKSLIEDGTTRAHGNRVWLDDIKNR